MARWTPLLGSALLAGCAVGPDFHRPAPPDIDRVADGPLITAAAATAGGEAQHLDTGLEIEQQWWGAFRSPEIDALVERALSANPDLQGAQAALRAATEMAAAARAALLPAVTGSYAVSKQQDAIGTLAPTLSSGAQIYSLHTAEIDVSYALDVFGGQRRQLESLLATAEAQRYQVQATYLTIVSNAVTAVIMQASVQTQLQLTHELIQTARDSLEILRHQYELGSISLSQVNVQESALAQQEATLPALEQQQIAQRDLLAQLTGQFPSQMHDTGLNLEALSLPQALPLSLPSQLVERRPDIRAAAAQLHAATAQVGAAVADMLPNISLSAGAGTTAVRLSQLLQPGTRFWNYGASLSQTLFDAGTLMHRKRAAVALMDQAAAQYRSTVLMAFRQVADTLSALQTDARALEAQLHAERSAANSLDIVRQNVNLGSASGLDLLTAQGLYNQAVVSLAQARAARLADTVALFTALGGAWWKGGA